MERKATFQVPNADLIKSRQNSVAPFVAPVERSPFCHGVGLEGSIVFERPDHTTAASAIRLRRIFFDRWGQQSRHHSPDACQR
jgi:hypothetical protein